MEATVLAKESIARTFSLGGDLGFSAIMSRFSCQKTTGEHLAWICLEKGQFLLSSQTAENVVLFEDF
jgi:hypothetical protein